MLYENIFSKIENKVFFRTVDSIGLITAIYCIYFICFSNRLVVLMI